jgi:hypothetical protein
LYFVRHTVTRKLSVSVDFSCMEAFTRDVTDDAFEAEFMTSRSEYNETLGYLNSLHRAHGE